MVNEMNSLINLMSRNGRTPSERNLVNKERSFKRYFNNTLNLHDCIVDGRPEKMVFQDHSQSNNKDLSDDKYIICENDVKIDVGSYVEWCDTKWLVFTKEAKTIRTHQQLKTKVVNETIKWIKNGKICNNGNGWGAYVQNQTLYTLGISRQGKYLDLVNAKMMMYMQNNEETMMLETGDRIFIGYSVYKVMFKDIVSRRGLINYLLEEDTIGTLDNRELRIADYYKQENSKAIENPIEDDGKHDYQIVPIIEGTKQARIGRSYEYHVENITVDEWMFDAIGNNTIEIIEYDNHKLSIRVKDDKRSVGQVATLYARNGKQIGSMVIRIATKF